MAKANLKTSDNSTVQATMPEDTLVKLLVRNYHKYGDKRIAMRRKLLGRWKEHTWKDYYESVKYFSLGLKTLGFERGDKIAIIGHNSPEWFWAELGAMAAGGVVAGLFVDDSPAEVKYQVERIDATMVVAKDQEQVDKMLEIIGQLPKVKKIICWQPQGLENYKHPALTTFAQVSDEGKRYEESHPGSFEENVSKAKTDDVALIIYTSGTTGLPKAVTMTHRQLLAAAEIDQKHCAACEKDEYLSYILPGSAMEQLYGIVISLLAGRAVSFPEATLTAAMDIRELSPTCIMQPSVMWENTASEIRTKIEAAGVLNRLPYRLFLPVGYKVADWRFRKKSVGWLWRVPYGAAYVIAYWVAFRPIKGRYGFLNVRDAVTTGAILSPDTIRFFHALGVPLRQRYQLTEALNVAGHDPDDIRPETVGKIYPEVRVKISEQGEILVGSEFTSQGYYNDPEQHQQVMRDGWLHTGDAGHIDEQGHLIYDDRLMDLMELAGGQKLAPQHIESRLRLSPYIRECIIIGGKDRPYFSALINLHFTNVALWAEKHRITYTTSLDLSQRDEISNLIGQAIMKVNEALPETCRVKKYVLLHKDFDPDDGELTRTWKLRRSYLENRYADLIGAIYSNEDKYAVEADVLYRDGRVGRMTTSIKIRTLKEMTS